MHYCLHKRHPFRLRFSNIAVVTFKLPSIKTNKQNSKITKLNYSNNNNNRKCISEVSSTISQHFIQFNIKFTNHLIGTNLNTITEQNNERKAHFQMSRYPAQKFSNLFSKSHNISVRGADLVEEIGKNEYLLRALKAQRNYV